MYQLLAGICPHVLGLKQRSMTKIEFIKEQIKEEIERLDKLEEERLLCKDYAGALKMESKREGCLRIWQIICCAENSKWEE